MCVKPGWVSSASSYPSILSPKSSNNGHNDTFIWLGRHRFKTCCFDIFFAHWKVRERRLQFLQNMHKKGTPTMKGVDVYLFLYFNDCVWVPVAWASLVSQTQLQIPVVEHTGIAWLFDSLMMGCEMTRLCRLLFSGLSCTPMIICAFGTALAREKIYITSVRMLKDWSRFPQYEQCWCICLFVCLCLCLSPRELWHLVRPSQTANSSSRARQDWIIVWHGIMRCNVTRRCGLLCGGGFKWVVLCFGMLLCFSSWWYVFVKFVISFW